MRKVSKGKRDWGIIWNEPYGTIRRAWFHIWVGDLDITYLTRYKGKHRK